MRHPGDGRHVLETELVAERPSQRAGVHRGGLELEAGTIYLTHMCMHYDEPITYAELVEFLKPYEGRVVAALDGMTLSI